MSTPAATTPAATTATPLGKQNELLKLTLLQLKEKARALGTPVTGTKAKLVQMIMNPDSHQKKRRSAIGKKQAPKKKAPKKTPGLYGMPTGHCFPTFGSHAAFGYDFDDDEGRCEMCGELGELDENGNCEECEGMEYCLDCDQPRWNLFRGTCEACMDHAVTSGNICPGCMKRSPPCEYCEESGDYVCCL